MKKMYYFLLAMLLYSFATSTYAQTEAMLTGTVADENELGVGFANVAVLDAATQAVVSGAIADMDGNFKIKTPAKGRYLLKINSLGYVTFQTPVFEVSGPDMAKAFGKLKLASDAKALKEVTVQALRPTIVNEADKMVVSVEGTALATGSTAYEVLEKSPGVWVDQDGNITLNGKGGVQILLNGKPSYLTGKDLQNLLQGMSAENLKDLEIITNPSSKYDAEGTSGIININLKKNELFGLNGGVYAGYQYNELHSYTTGGNVNIKTGKWNTAVNADFSRRPRFRDMETERVVNSKTGKKSLTQDGREEGYRISPTLRLATDYDLNDKHSVGIVANLQYSDNNNSFGTRGLLRDMNPANDTLILSTTTANGTYYNSTFNLHYTGKLGAPGTTLSADADFAKISNEDETGMVHSYKRINSTEPGLTNLFGTENPTNYKIYSAKTDFAKQLGEKSKLELGAKISHVISDNELNFFEINDGIRTKDLGRSSHFIFTEDILAGYANFSTSIGDKWKVQTGLRAEQTFAEGNARTLNKINDRSYLNFFPSVFVQQQVSENYQIGYKYSRRISRPYYGHLNPFVFYIDPNTLATGNPYLRPQYTNSFEITQMFKQTYNLVLGYAVTKDFIGEVPVFYKEKNQTIFERRNMDDFTNMEATLVAPVRVLPGKWEINNNVSLDYQQFTVKVKEVTETKEQLNFSAQSSNNISLPKGLRLELTGTYQGPGVYGLFEFEDQWWIDAGLKRSFLNDKLTLTMNVTDIFRSRQLKLNTVVDGNTNKIDQYHGMQSVRLHLRYNFNKGKAFESKKRNVNLEELNRTGN
ncbi:TonB-dependent receptor [Pontibacter sp. BT310]|uniref:TonB-dependent receptor n=1 Tax=Pontibacter populi TaxID=890055 RepID=A0ABS6XB05_9BACT|nr:MULTISPECIES: TonB-dependent receptor family protein [Pontibacter]MBJ6118337.1 TonB-dependent receptor [Pontibacter sp. BT310]MBR0570764.1 TonB-dependent receptor [Microvirga sp. STS03]MBW3365190.1 TonB-dependent receptor [Pontibacter populi]